MSAAQHTPGPWSVTAHRTGDYGDATVGYDNGMIAIVAGGNWGEWRDADDNGDAEFLANARLIAAAPDLLAACLVAAPLVAAYRNDDAMWAAYTQLIAAIAKVEALA